MRNIMKKAVSLLVAMCLTMSMVLLVACNKKGNEGNTSSSEKTGNVTSSTPTPTINDIKLENRSGYNAQALLDGYLDSTLYDVSYGQKTSSDIVKGYLVGDVYNILIDAISNQLAATPNLEKLNVDILYFSRDTKGVWRNYSKAEVHPIINKLLNYKLDGSEELSFTESELKTYGDIKLYSLYRESLSKTKVMVDGVTVSDGNKALTNMINQIFDELLAVAIVPVVSETLNATVSEMSTLLAGSREEKSAMLEKIYGGVKLGDVAVLFGKDLSAELYDLPLTAIVDEISLMAQMGFDAYFAPKMEAIGQTTMGAIMSNFGIALPENLASYTLCEVLAEIEAMNHPILDNEDTTNEEIEQSATGFFVELREYVASSDICVSKDGTVILGGEEFMGYVMYAMEIISASIDPESTTAQNIETVVAALNEFVAANDERFSAIVAAMEADGAVISIDETTTMLPSEAYVALKDFLTKGEAYQEMMYYLSDVSLEEYLELNGVSIQSIGVDKVDDFVNKYKAMSIAELMDSGFVEEYMELQASLTLSEKAVLSGYATLMETNNAVSAFMAKYGALTEAELAIVKEDAEYLEDLITLYKGITLRELLQAYMA